MTNEDDPMGDAIIETHKLRDAALSAAGGSSGENEHAPLRGWDFDLPLVLNGASGAPFCSLSLFLSFSLPLPLPLSLPLFSPLPALTPIFKYSHDLSQANAQQGTSPAPSMSSGRRKRRWRRTSLTGACQVARCSDGRLKIGIGIGIGIGTGIRMPSIILYGPTLSSIPSTTPLP